MLLNRAEPDLDVDFIQKTPSTRKIGAVERCQLAQSAPSHLAWQIQNDASRVMTETERSALSRTSFIEQSQSYYSF